MKTLKISLFILLFICITSQYIYSENDFQFEINLKPTYEEGFGVLMKRDFELVKSPAHKRVKNQDNDAIYILVKKMTKTTPQVVLLIDCDNKLRSELEILLENSNSVKVTAVGMETIEASGIPGLSMSFARDELNEKRFEHLELPGGPGWGVRKIFQIRWCEIHK